MASEVRRILVSLAAMRPARQVALGYGLYMLLGWVLLCLPWSVAPGSSVGALDHLFTAVSAVSTTGLVTVATGQTYTGFGEAVILVLILLGGMGYMTLGSFLVLARREELPRHRSGVARVVFSLPDGFTVRSVVRNTILFALTIQVVGAGALWWAFREAGSARPLWDAVFHSVSAFCTAGFGLYGDSLESFRGDFRINAIVGVLSVLGAIGFLVMTDLYRRFTLRTKALTLTTRIVLWGAALIIGGAALLMYLFEPSIRSLPPHERAIASLFQAMSASTTVGFNTLPIAPLSDGTTALLLVVMLIGAAPAGTGGGLKITTMTAIIAVIGSTLRGSVPVTFAQRELPMERVRAAVASMGLSLMTLMAAVYILALSETAPLLDLAFEATSALATVGLSRGVTGSLTPMGQLVIIALMYIGRVGPTVLAMSILTRPPSPPTGREDLSI